MVRRQQISAAAGDLILKYGSEHVTVRRIAKEIGVSEGAIYRHFRSKREVLAFLVDDTEKALRSDIENNRSEGKDALENLKEIIVHVEARKGISFQVIAEIISFGDKRLNEKVRKAVNNYVGLIRDVLSEGVMAGIIKRDVNLDAAATMYYGMVEGLVNIWTLSHYDFSLVENFASLWDMYRRIVQAAPASAETPQQR